MAPANQDALEQAIKSHLKRAGLSQAAVARKLHYTPAQFNKWLKGVNRFPDYALQALSDLLELSDKERTELFRLADYVAVSSLTPSNPSAGIDTVSAGQDVPIRSRNPSNMSGGFFAFFAAAVKDWGKSFFRWDEAPDHMKSSWAGVVLYELSVVISHITARGLLIFCLSTLLGILTGLLVTPVLLWPQQDLAVRQAAYLKYGLATLLIPLLVSIVTPPEQPNLFQLRPAKRRLIFWVSKFSGALVGFWVFSAACLSLALALYYLHLPPLAGYIRVGVALIPLFFSYIAARRIPFDRYKMFNGEVRLHPADKVVLAVFLVVGPFTALFFFMFYWFFSDRTLAPISILIVLTGMALWRYRKQARQPAPDAS